MEILYPYRKEGDKIIQKSDHLKEIIKFRLEGLSLVQIKERMEPFQLSKSALESYHHEAGECIRELQENDVLSTRVIHAQRYEWFYEWFLENDFDDKAMKMLECIEKLLGLHSNTIGLSIHNLVEQKKAPNIYDYNKLTEQEHARLKFLVGKAKK